VLISLFYALSALMENHQCPWCVASATPDLRIPSRPQGVTAHWPVPNYTAWWQRHMHKFAQETKEVATVQPRTLRRAKLQANNHHQQANTQLLCLRPHRAEALSNDVCLTSVCRVHRAWKSREQRGPGRLKLAQR